MQRQKKNGSKKYTDDYTDNVSQVKERMEKAIETAKTDGSLWDAKSGDGRTFKEGADEGIDGQM